MATELNEGYEEIPRLTALGDSCSASKYTERVLP